MRTRKLTSLALFATLALAIYSAESLLPPIVPIPGIKLGLANIITLLVLHLYDVKARRRCCWRASCCRPCSSDRP